MLVPVHDGIGAHYTLHAGRAAVHLPLQLWGLHWHCLSISTWKGKQRNCVRGRKHWSLEPGLCCPHTGKRGERKKGLQDQNEVARRTGRSNMLPVCVKPGNENKALQVEKASNDWEEEMTHLAHPMVVLQCASMEGVKFTNKLNHRSNSVERT